MSDETQDEGKLARGEGTIDPEYAREQAAAPEPIQRMDIEPTPRTIINMQRERRSIE